MRGKNQPGQQEATEGTVLLAVGHLALGALVTGLEVRPNTVSLQVTETNTQNRK